MSRKLNLHRAELWVQTIIYHAFRGANVLIRGRNLERHTVDASAIGAGAGFIRVVEREGSAFEQVHNVMIIEAVPLIRSLITDPSRQIEIETAIEPLCKIRFPTNSLFSYELPPDREPLGRDGS